MKSSFRLLAIGLVAAVANSASVRGAIVYGVAVQGTTQLLVTWDSSAPGTILSSNVIAGLPAGETIRGIDFDPVFNAVNQKLFAIGAGSDAFANVYRLQLSTGFASKLPAGAAPRADAGGQSYGVTSVGSGALRSVSDIGYAAGYDTTFNMGVVQATMVYAQGEPHAGEAPHLVHRYNNFAIDTAFDALTTVAVSGNPRQVTTIGSLGANFDDAGGIDGDDSTGTVFGALLPAGQTASSFYTLNLQTGATTLIGAIGSGRLITAMAVQPPLVPVPEPTAATLLAISLVGALLRVHACRRYGSSRRPWGAR